MTFPSQEILSKQYTWEDNGLHCSLRDKENKNERNKILPKIKPLRGRTRFGQLCDCLDKRWYLPNSWGCTLGDTLYSLFISSLPASLPPFLPPSSTPPCTGNQTKRVSHVRQIPCHWVPVPPSPTLSSPTEDLLLLFFVCISVMCLPWCAGDSLRTTFRS